MRGVVFGIATMSCSASIADPVWNTPRMTASEQGLVPAIITTQEWVGDASVLCADGHDHDKQRRWLWFRLLPDRCIALSYRDVEIRCAATLPDDHTLRLSVTYEHSRPPPYRTPSDDCDLSGWIRCSVDAPPPGNYVVELGDLRLPLTVGYGHGVGPCTNGESR